MVWNFILFKKKQHIWCYYINKSDIESLLNYLKLPGPKENPIPCHIAITAITLDLSAVVDSCAPTALATAVTPIIFKTKIKIYWKINIYFDMKSIHNNISENDNIF